MDSDAKRTEDNRGLREFRGVSAMGPFSLEANGIDNSDSDISARGSQARTENVAKYFNVASRIRRKMTVSFLSGNEADDKGTLLAGKAEL